MPRKRSSTSRSSAHRRLSRLKKNYSWKIVPVLYKETLEMSTDLVEYWLLIQDMLEIQVFQKLEEDSVDTSLQLYYMTFARRLFAKCLRFWFATYGLERTSFLNEFVLRGLDLSELEAIADIVDYKCMVVKNLLAAPRYSMTFLSVIDNEIDLPAAAADLNLPDVVISGLPTGATIDKVLVFLIVRAIENTNAGGPNAIQATQYIRIKKSTGAWGVDDLAAIQLIDNLWTVAASTREFGDVIGGDDARDVKAEVDGNATYNLRFENADVDLDFLRLNDVQVLIKVWYH